MHVCAQCNGTDLFFLSDHDVREAGEGEEVSGVQPVETVSDVKKIYVFKNILVLQPFFHR